MRSAEDHRHFSKAQRRPSALLRHFSVYLHFSSALLSALLRPLLRHFCSTPACHGQQLVPATWERKQLFVSLSPPMYHPHQPKEVARASIGNVVAAEGANMCFEPNDCASHVRMMSCSPYLFLLTEAFSTFTDTASLLRLLSCVSVH